VYLLYSIATLIVLVALSPYFLYQALRHKKYVGSLSQRLGYLPVTLNLDGDPSIWIHAVSVGEALMTRALIPELRRRYPGLRIFVSTTTLTGQHVARTRLHDVDAVFFFPFDLPVFVTPDGSAFNSQILRLSSSSLRTVPTTLDNLRHMPFTSVNLSLTKNFKLGEGKRLQISGEAINAFNHPYFIDLSADPTNASFGLYSTPSKVSVAPVRIDSSTAWSRMTPGRASSGLTARSASSTRASAMFR
jgi:hypothetical protein